MSRMKCITVDERTDEILKELAESTGYNQSKIIRMALAEFSEALKGESNKSSLLRARELLANMR